MSATSVFAGALALLSAAFVGIWLKKRLIRRATFYEDYYEYLLFASEKIGYERMPIGELNRRFGMRKQGEFLSFLQKEAVSPALTREQLAQVREYLDGIGTTDAETQIASLKGKCAEMKRFAETDCVKYRKDGALYFKLSVLVGVVIFIILV